MQRTQETDVRVSQISLVSREYEGAHFQQVLTARRERTMLVVLRYTPKKKIFKRKSGVTYITRFFRRCVSVTNRDLLCASLLCTLLMRSRNIHALYTIQIVDRSLQLVNRFCMQIVGANAARRDAQSQQRLNFKWLPKRAVPAIKKLLFRIFFSASLRSDYSFSLLFFS